MGSSNSKANAEEENRQRLEAERQEQQRKAQEQERRRKQQEEQRKREEQQRLHEEVERKRKADEELEQKRKEEKEREDKVREYQHLQEMQKLKDLEQGNQRKDTLAEKEYQLEHERLVQGQEQMFQILKETFGKVKDVDINQAVYSAYIMQCIHAGKSIDKEVLAAVAAKVPTPAPPNLEQIVENVIQKCDEVGNFDDDYMDRRNSSLSSHA